MDARQNAHVTERLSTIPRIRKRTAEWVGAQPSRSLHGLLAASWLGFLYTMGMFSTPTAEEVAAASAPLGFVDSFALAMFLVTLGGIFAVLSFAATNSKVTAPVSALCALSIIVVGAMLRRASPSWVAASQRRRYSSVLLLGLGELSNPLVEVFDAAFCSADGANCALCGLGVFVVNLEA